MEQLGVDKASNVFNRRQLEASLKIAMNTRGGEARDGYLARSGSFHKSG